VQCGECAEKCPQHIDIPYWMSYINEVHQAQLPKQQEG
jgi:predicted aldo/keto reductase-like oxidoreductase